MGFSKLCRFGLNLHRELGHCKLLAHTSRRNQQYCSWDDVGSYVKSINTVRDAISHASTVLLAEVNRYDDTACRTSTSFQRTAHTASVNHGDTVRISSTARTDTVRISSTARTDTVRIAYTLRTTSIAHDDTVYTADISHDDTTRVTGISYDDTVRTTGITYDDTVHAADITYHDTVRTTSFLAASTHSPPTAQHHGMSALLYSMPWR